MNMYTLTEVNIGIDTGTSIKVGRIDLLAISDDKVIIIDYKTDSNPPTRGSDIPPQYVKQLKFYKSAIQDIYKTSTVLVKILWLENLNFMQVLEDDGGDEGNRTPDPLRAKQMLYP